MKPVWCEFGDSLSCTFGRFQVQRDPTIGVMIVEKPAEPRFETQMPIAHGNCLRAWQRFQQRGHAFPAFCCRHSAFRWCLVHAIPDETEFR